ncbi:glutaminyl-peptide cyclotransferase [Malassezia furfur]|uniref:Peptide hydrolase n=1 Tax=Malassezia furfur TaxID=55194 RepID=A0ABY8EJN3_MALFU|nr:glutaminyl-peptide cyclotransferase [Malassezia furfur]
MRLASVGRWLVCAVAAVAAHTAAAAAEARGTPLSDAAVAALVAPDPAPVLDYRNADSLLARILIPRVAGTENSTRVRNALIEALSAPKDAHGQSKWHIETQTFDAQTPLGVRRMTNIVATRDPHASRHLVLAAHYDSKYFPPGPLEAFVGATDSAAPCAMLVDIALALDAQLDAHVAQQAQWRAAHPHADGSNDTTLQLVFFDGEEAFQVWTATDSVYGARQLAQTLAQTWVAPNQTLLARHMTGRGRAMRAIQKMEHFVLLDLLGAPNPRVPYYFPDTKWMHTRLQDIEARLASLQLLYPRGDTQKRMPMLDPRHGPSGIGDDHLPFLAEGVPILHLIPLPFPSVWHRISDDASALDYAVVHAWAKLLRVFVAEVLDLPVL